MALVRTFPGARFLPDLRAWSVPFASVRALHGVVDRMEAFLARAAAAAQTRRASRILMLLALRPIAGALVAPRRDQATAARIAVM
ncbi:hypothetical protein VQ02_30480 [Methylobacterium variabile]|uniref:Uncharacterized protein n=1 Tax=Methylobacterium variabile TaxID=298794 RepID=A0A0J6S1Q2_9HYPH|nr:hypothetical protein [Methylobacterium variabile]KMO29105.1 hypothetical protein VQ02_30480 [Methylobacterium variabile]